MTRLSRVDELAQSSPNGTTPTGFRCWQPGDDNVADPILGRGAYHGPVGAYLDLLVGNTEAHPAAVGLQCLGALGTRIGRRAMYRAGRQLHHCNLYGIVVGPSSEGAKGVADGEAEYLVELVAPGFYAAHGIGGLGSGEVLIRLLDDAAEPPADRRRIVHDAEFSAVLKVVDRDTCILGDILRNAYDYRPLRHTSIKNGRSVATGHHIAVIGSITPNELRARLDDLELVNGFANRFLFAWSRITTLLPFGGVVDEVAVGAIADRIVNALDALEQRHERARGRPVEFTLDRAAKRRWIDFYNERRTGIGDGIIKALTARQVAQAARLALIYAVLDTSSNIRVEHIGAAIAWCDYSIATAQKVFTAEGIGKAAKLLKAIRAATPDGLTGREQHNVFSNNLQDDELDELRATLEAQNLIYTYQSPTGGRPRLTSVALSPLPSPVRTTNLTNKGP
jgi:hypothetical protein